MNMQVERRELAPGVTLSRILTGLWQVADMERSGWQIDLESAAAAMRPYVDAGLTSFDMADHYGSAEDIVGSFGKDKRILIWDLYNEPGNSRMGEKSLPLAEAAFAWARATNPSQPLTIGTWTRFEGKMSKRLMELSDIVSFHGYDGVEGIRNKISYLTYIAGYLS